MRDLMRGGVEPIFNDERRRWVQPRVGSEGMYVLSGNMRASHHYQAHDCPLGAVLIPEIEKRETVNGA